MDVELLLHVEPADTESGVSWWAERPDVGGFYAVADTLEQLRVVAHEALIDELGDQIGQVRERLAGSGDANDDGVRMHLVSAP